MNEEQPKERTELEKQIDEELASMPKEEVLKQFDESTELKVPGKKDKKLKPKQVYCSTCREWLLEERADKRPMGFLREEDGTISTRANRFSIFCPLCSKFLSISDPETDEKIKDAINKVGNK